MNLYIQLRVDVLSLSLSLEKTKDYTVETFHSIKRTSPHQYAGSFSSAVKSTIAISINLRTGCKSRAREIVFPAAGIRAWERETLDIPASSLRFPGAELFRGVAARIKASCGIKNLCNQLSNLLPHISRPMSRHPRRRL